MKNKCSGNTLLEVMSTHPNEVRQSSLNFTETSIIL